MYFESGAYSICSCIRNEQLREKEELRPELSVKMHCCLLRWKRLGKSMSGDIGRKYQVFIFERVIDYIASKHLNGNAK